MPFKNIHKFSALSLVALLLLCPQPASAQERINLLGQGGEEEEAKPFWAYDPAFRPQAQKSTTSQSLLSNSLFSMHFVRTEGAGPDEATLRFSQPVSASGCVNIHAPRAKITGRGSSLRIELGSPAITLDKSVRYAHIDCKQAPSGVQTDIVLNRKQMYEDGVKRITFQNEFGVDTYNIKLGKNAIAMRPKSRPQLFQPNTQIHNKDPLLHYFYPKNTVILSVPQAKAPGDVYGQVKKLAGQKGLIELQSVVKDFRVLNEDSKNFYFIDQSGMTTADLELGQSNRFGKAVVQETYYGPGGAYEENLAIDIYARLPGALD